MDTWCIKIFSKNHLRRVKCKFTKNRSGVDYYKLIKFELGDLIKLPK